jgi:beta-xylosidase
MSRTGAMLAGVVVALAVGCGGGGGGERTLVVHVSGNGTTDPAPGSYTFKDGATVTLTATPRSGGTFAGWGGAVTGTASTVEVKLDGDRTVMASFTGGEGFAWATPVTTYDNPVLPGDHPDQNIFVEDGVFYLTGSGFGMSPYVEIQRSTDLLHWERVSRVVSPAWSELQATIAGGGTWGAFIVKPDASTYRVYFAVNYAQWFAEASSLEGPWSDPVKLNSLPYTPPDSAYVFNRGNGYDDSVFVDEDGTTYLVQKAAQCSWNGLAPGQANDFGMNLLVKIDPITGMLVPGSAIDLSWVNDATGNGGCGMNQVTANWAEGPTLMKKDGYYYYFVSSHTGCGGKEYAWRAAALSSDPADWTPLGVVLDGSAPFSGAQHSTAPFRISDGTWWAFSHSYSCGEWEGLARQSLLSQVTWAPDGAAERPVFEGSWSPQPAPALTPSAAPFLLPFNDDFGGTTLRTGWTFMGYMPADRTSLTDRPGWLRVKPPAGTTVHVVQREALHAHAMVARLDFSATGAADVAGLRLGNVVPQEQLGQMPSWTNAKSMELSLVKTWWNGAERIRFGLGEFAFGAVPIPTTGYLARAPAGPVWLKIERTEHRATGWYSADGINWTQVGPEIDISTLDSKSSMSAGWVGTQAGVFASNEPADFDSFAYRDGFSTTLARETDQQNGTQLATSSGQGQVLSMTDGSWALYGSLELAGAGGNAGAIELTAASAPGATLEVWLDPLAGGTRVATCAVPATGGWNTFKTITCPLSGTGSREVYLRAAGGSGELVRLASFRFAPTLVAAPVFAPDGGSVGAAAAVTLSTPTAGASIRYTTDGTEPSATVGTVYAAPFTLGASGSTTVKAIAYADGLGSSAVVTRAFTIAAGGQAAAPEFTPAEGTYDSAQSVSLGSATAGADIYYTKTDDGTEPPVPTTASAQYLGPITLAQTAAPGASRQYRLKAIAVMPGMTSSPVASATYAITTPGTAAWSLKVTGTTQTQYGDTSVSVNFAMPATNLTTEDYVATFDIYIPSTSTATTTVQTQYPNSSWAAMYFDKSPPFQTDAWQTLTYTIKKANRSYPPSTDATPLNSDTNGFRVVFRTAAAGSPVEFYLRNLRVTNGTNTPLDITITSATQVGDVDHYTANGTGVAYAIVQR